MPEVTLTSLKAKINDLKTRVAHNSISPVFVGGILDEIVDASMSADEAAAAQSTADRALALATANSDRIDLHSDDINNLENGVAGNAADIRANTGALTILNRRGQVESFAAVLTTDPDDDPIPAELVGKRVWSTQFNKFLEINIVGDPPYQTPEDSAAVVDKFYVCDGRLYLGVKVSQTATTLKPLFDSEIEQLSRTHSITLTAGDDGALSWSGAEHTKIRNGDVVTWENMGVLFRGTVISRTSSGSYDTLAVAYDFDGDEPLELHVLWINSNGTATDACFSSDQTLASAFNARQTKLENTTDVVIESETNTTDGLYVTDSAKRAVFNDMFNLAAGSDGGYKPSEAPDPTKPYLLNTLWLSYEEAVKIYAINGADAGHVLPDIGHRFSQYYGASYMQGVRTLFRVVGKTTMSGMFFMCRELEVLNLEITGGYVEWLLRGNSKLWKVIGSVNIKDLPANYRLIVGAPLLEEITIKGLSHNVGLDDAPKLSLATMQYLVDNASTAITAAKPVVVTVHADVFAKLTGDTTNEAAAALTDDEKTAWAAVLTAATSKYISFATD